MQQRIFLAGGSGVLAARLVPRLRAAGHTVAAMTRTPTKVAMIERWGR